MKRIIVFVAGLLLLAATVFAQTDTGIQEFTDEVAKIYTAVYEYVESEQRLMGLQAEVKAANGLIESGKEFAKQNPSSSFYNGLPHLGEGILCGWLIGRMAYMAKLSPEIYGPEATEYINSLSEGRPEYYLEKGAADLQTALECFEKQDMPFRSQYLPSGPATYKEFTQILLDSIKGFLEGMRFMQQPLPTTPAEIPTQLPSMPPISAAGEAAAGKPAPVSEPAKSARPQVSQSSRQPFLKKWLYPQPKGLIYCCTIKADWKEKIESTGTDYSDLETYSFKTTDYFILVDWGMDYEGKKAYGIYNYLEDGIVWTPGINPFAVKYNAPSGLVENITVRARHYDSINGQHETDKFQYTPTTRPKLFANFYPSTSLNQALEHADTIYLQPGVPAIKIPLEVGSLGLPIFVPGSTLGLWASTISFRKERENLSFSIQKLLEKRHIMEATTISYTATDSASGITTSDDITINWHIFLTPWCMNTRFKEGVDYEVKKFTPEERKRGTMARYNPETKKVYLDSLYRNYDRFTIDMLVMHEKPHQQDDLAWPGLYESPKYLKSSKIVKGVIVETYYQSLLSELKAFKIQTDFYLTCKGPKDVYFNAGQESYFKLGGLIYQKDGRLRPLHEIRKELLQYSNGKYDFPPQGVEY